MPINQSYGARNLFCVNVPNILAYTSTMDTGMLPNGELPKDLHHKPSVISASLVSDAVSLLRIGWIYSLCPILPVKDPLVANCQVGLLKLLQQVVAEQRLVRPGGCDRSHHTWWQPQNVPGPCLNTQTDRSGKLNKWHRTHSS